MSYFHVIHTSKHAERALNPRLVLSTDSRDVDATISAWPESAISPCYR
jgi:hypothetical protein